MTLAQWLEKTRARFAWRSAERSLAAGKTALAAAHFAEAAARARSEAALLRRIHGAAGRSLLNAGAARGAIGHFLALAEINPADTTILRQLVRAGELAGDRAAETLAWRMLLDCEPGCIEAHKRLADLSYETDRKAALPHLEALAAAFPEKAEIWRRLARAHAANKNDDRETQAWRRVSALDPSDLDAHQRLADLFWSQDRKHEALPHLEALARAQRGDFEHWERLANARAGAGEEAGEIAARRKLLRQHGHDFSARQRVGEFYLAKGAPHRALPFFRAASASRPKNKKLLSDLAASYRLLHRSDEEIETLTKLFAAGSRGADVACRLGGLLIGKGRPLCAVAVLRQAAKSSPDVEVLRLLAEALEAANAANDDIIEAWRAILAKSEEDFAAHERLSRYLVAEGRWAEAAPHLRRVAEERPDDKVVLLDLARALDVAGDEASRIAAWRALWRRDETDIEAHRRLADLLNSRPEEAIPHLEALTASAPADSALWRRLAESRRALGDTAGEKEARLRVIDLNADDMEAHGRLAEIFLEEGNANRAATHLEAWLRGMGEDQPAWEKLARLKDELGDESAALEAWRRAAALGPLDADASGEAARLCLSAQLPEEAIGHLKRVLETRPRDEMALRDLAKAYQATAMRDEEITVWEHVLTIAPDDARAVRRLGDLHYGLRHFPEAAPYLRRAAGNEPANLRLARRLARAGRAIGDAADEIGAWKLVLALQADDLEAHRRLGDLFFGLALYECSAPHLARVAEADPHNERLARRLVKAHRRAGDVAGEIDALKRLIALTPTDRNARPRIVELLQAEGGHEEAVHYLKAAVAEEPTNANLQRMLAVSCQRLNDADGELAALRGLVKLEPANSEAHRRCGELLFEREAFCDAEIHLRAAARAFPDDVAVQRRLAHCLRVAEKPRDELPVLRRLVTLADDDIAAHRRLGEILLEEGASEEGLVHLRRCVALAPSDADCQRALAEALSVSEIESSESAAAWARLVELAPGDLIARRRLADAYFETARYPDAEAIYQTLAEASPGDPDLWRKRAQAARALRGADGEEGVLRSAITALSDPGEFLYALAALRVEVDAEDGVETMRAAWNAHRDPSQYAGLCGKLVEAHRVDAAITEYTMLLHEAPQSFAGWLGLGDIMSRTERHRLAATYFGKAYEISGENSHCKRWMGSLLLAGAFETIERNCAALSEEALGDENMQSQYAQALAGLGRFEEARKIAETSHHPPDDQLREGFLRYLALRARPKTSIDSPETSKSPAEQMALQAEARQARGDLSGAAQIYRAGGAALRRCFAHISADGAEVSGPDFLIIGAPRSGSSWLKNCLKRHPQLRVAQGEPGYFSAFPHFSPAIYAKRLGLVDPLPEGIGREAGASKIGRPIFGEKTPEYLTLPDNAIELCAALYPYMRIICLVREPVARAWSHLKHCQLAARDADFYRDEEGKIPQWLSRLVEFGRYERNLKRWARRFPANQFLIADFDSIRTDPLGLLDHVQEFLGADKTDFSELTLDAEKLVGATAALAPPPDVERLLADVYEGEIYDAALLRRTIGEAADARGEASKAA